MIRFKHCFYTDLVCAQVMEARTEQIEDRMLQVKERQEESLRHREQLLRELEIANQLTRRDMKKAEEEKEQLKLDLKQQVKISFDFLGQKIYKGG